MKALDLEIARLAACVDVENHFEGFLAHDDVIDGMRAARDNAAQKLRELEELSDGEWALGQAMQAAEDSWSEVRKAVLAAISASYGA